MHFNHINKILPATIALAFFCLTGVLCPDALSAPPIKSEERDLVKKGYEQIEKGQYDVAVKTLCQAVQTDRNAVVPRRYLAYALTRAGSHQTALEQLDIVSKMGPLSSFDYYLYGEAYYGLGKFAEAKEAYQSAVSSSENFDHARGGQVKSLVKLSQFDQAKRVCLAGLQQSKSAESKKYYQTLFEGVQQATLNPINDWQQIAPTGAGTGPVNLGMPSSE